MIRENEKILPAGCTAGRTMATGTNHHESPDSIQKCTTSTAERQPFRISDLLLCGAENAISRRDLMSLTGCQDRELRRLIEAERRSGVPILSDNANGYFLPSNQAERDRFVQSMRRRASEILETAQAIEEVEV